MKTMEDKKLIVKKSDKYDGRQVNVFLTSLGDKKKIIAKETIKGFNDILKKQISKEELSSFLSTLEKINQLAEENYSN
jgi:DNA-binding MarR family transcriptional regulator